jgi:hypothetical protein
VRGGNGLVDGVYGNEKLIEDAGVCESEGVVLRFTCDVEARLYRGRPGRTPVSGAYVADWNWRKYLEASDSFLAFSSPDVVLSSEDSSEKAHDERFDRGAVGERGGTISRK